jgi:hypothetical protein
MTCEHLSKDWLSVARFSIPIEARRKSDSIALQHLLATPIAGAQLDRQTPKQYTSPCSSMKGPNSSEVTLDAFGIARGVSSHACFRS